MFDWRPPQWLVPALTIMISIVTMVNVFLLAGLVGDGKKARDTQCALAPLGRALYTAAAQVHLRNMDHPIITQDQLQTYLKYSPTDKDCKQ